MNIKENCKVSLSKLKNNTYCPICNKKLHWEWEGILSDYLQAYCCGKIFNAKPCIYNIKISEDENAKYRKEIVE